LSATLPWVTDSTCKASSAATEAASALRFVIFLKARDRLPPVLDEVVEQKAEEAAAV
jgi:hypothetical protein